jgi:hypothetical protein
VGTDNHQDSLPIERDIVVGKNSKIWKTLSLQPLLAAKVAHAIGHGELANFAFKPTDRVWVFSYSRNSQENTHLIQTLGNANIAELIYVSSSSVKVASKTTCYEYPRVKHNAELTALAQASGKVLTIGLVYDQELELPAGDNIATSMSQLHDFMMAPKWPEQNGRRKQLFKIVSRPFGGVLERTLHALYGALLTLCGPLPCLLRPFDLVLRALGMRWYGYTFLSNRIWISTIS